MPLTCAITGANGYVGSAIANYLEHRCGCTIYRLSRDAEKYRNPFFIPYALESEVDPRVLDPAGALIHCAYDFRLTSRRQIWEVNVEGTMRLFRAARQAGVKKMIFVSTMSAFETCKSLYGKAKLEIEKRVCGQGVSIVRPGLVFGPSPGSMVGNLGKLVERLPVVPLFGGGNQLFHLVHEDDLSELTYRLCTSLEISEPVPAACDRPMTFRSILEHLAALKKKKPFFVRTPWRMIYLLLRATEAARVPLGFRSDSLISLLNQDPSPNFDAAHASGVLFRNFTDWAADQLNRQALPCAS